MKKIIGLLLITMLAASCKKGSSGGSDDGGSTPAPQAALLTAPLKDQVCTTGADITDTTSSIAFNWQSAQGANSYELTVKNLLTQAVVTKTVQGTELEVTLSKNTPYSWYVTSKANNAKATTKSEVWKFYNAGNGMVVYAPYPAEILAPTYGQHVTTTNGKIKLSWKGSVASGKIAAYSVYFGPSTNPELFRANITDSFVDDVAVSANTTYYWHVVTGDSNGNVTDSGMFNFFVEK